MSAEYYIFAFYVFILICVVIFLCRALFANVRKQRIQLEEKEAKLLKLFSSVEDAMDEFFDMASESKAEIDEALRKLSSLVGSLYKAGGGSEAVPGSKAEKENRYEETSGMGSMRGMGSMHGMGSMRGTGGTGGEKAAGPVSDLHKVSIKAGESKEKKLPGPADLPHDALMVSKTDTILDLSRGGKTRAQIARELNITQNEVDLVIGMHKKTRMN